MKSVRVILLLVTLLAPQAAHSQRRRSIRSVDFRNFTYSIPAYPNVEPRVVRNGEIAVSRDAEGFITDGGTLEFVTYGDVTGDGVEEAIIFISIVSGGSSIPGEVYVYKMRRNRPKLLWNFSTGDRADGGLHGVYAEKGRLVVELNGPKRGMEPDCCPKRFTRTRYKWRGGRFQRVRKQTLPIKSG